MSGGLQQYEFDSTVRGRVLTISLIGGLRIAYGLHRLEVRKKKAAALLALLAVSSDGRITREEARNLLWPDSDDSAAQTSLRNALWSLKSTLKSADFNGFYSDRTDIWLQLERFETDIDICFQDLDRGFANSLLKCDPQAVARLDRGYGTITDNFTSKMAEAATHFARLIRQKLAGCVANAPSDAEKIAILQFVADMDPTDEGAARDLILAYWHSGQLANALAAYQSLWNIVDQNFGEEPSSETQALIVEIKTGAMPGAAQNVDTRPRIIIEPGQFLHLDRVARAQAGQLRDDLCANFARFREWQVFDAALVSNPATLADVERKTYGLSLHAAEIKDGLAYRTVLADKSSGELLWSEKFEGPTLRFSPDQSGLADRMAVALNLHLSAYRGRSGIKREAAPGAYERWVEAQGQILQFTTHSWKQAEENLDALIWDYPNFGRAYSSRASIENMRQISFPGLYSTPELHLKALKLAGKAIDLDPMDSRGQLAMGWSSAMSRQFGRAELAFDLAFQYNENDPWTITSSAVGLAFCDHFDAAQQLLDVLFGLNFRLESSHWSYVAATMFMGKDYKGCVEASEKSNEISHDVPAWHAAALALLGHRQEARKVAQRFEKIAVENWAGAGPGNSSEITRWLVSGFPIRNRDTWLALRDGLRQAGMPVPDLIQSEKIALGYQMGTGE